MWVIMWVLLWMLHGRALFAWACWVQAPSPPDYDDGLPRSQRRQNMQFLHRRLIAARNPRRSLRLLGALVGAALLGAALLGGLLVKGVSAAMATPRPPPTTPVST